MGFCVASTMNGASRGYVTPPTVTACSCIASSSADCVFGVARFTSSASTMLANTGPRWKRTRRPPPPATASCTSTLVPMMSAGIRSGVNWMREVGRSSTRPRLLMSVVLPRPGHALEQRVPAAGEAREHAVHDGGVAHDGPADLGAQRRHPFAHPCCFPANVCGLHAPS